MFDELRKQIALELTETVNKPVPVQKPGNLGYQDANGDWQIEVTGSKNRVWVNTEGNVIQAVNMGVPLEEDFPVVVEFRPGRETLVRGPFVEQALEYTQDGTSLGIAAPGPHSHRLDSGNVNYVEAQRFEPGLVRPTGIGLLLDVLGFSYEFNGERYSFPSTQKSPAIPTTIDTHRWAVMHVDVSTTPHTITWTYGSSQSTVLPLVKSDAEAIDIGDGFALGYVRTRYGQLTVDPVDDIVDARPWFTNHQRNQPASTVILDSMTGATYTTVQEMQNIFHSAGWAEGGTITDAGGGTVNVAAGSGYIRATDDILDTLLAFDWPAVTGQAITTDAARYIGVEYNSGTPQITIRTIDDFDKNTDFLLGTVVNDGGTLHIQNTPWQVADHAGAMIERLVNTAGFLRASGLLLGESGDGNRYVTVSAGELWYGLTEFHINALDTSVTGSFTMYYSDGGGGFTAVTGQTQWDNTHYDDGSGTLATMSNNWYANLWFYIEPDGDVIGLYGTAQDSNIGNVLDRPIPTSLPLRLQVHGRLIGRIVFKKSATTAEDVQSAFTTSLGTGAATAFSDLSGYASDSQLVLAPVLAPATTERNRITPAAADAKGLVIQAHASQSEDLFAIHASNGTSYYVEVLSNGNVYILSDITTFSNLNISTGLRLYYQTISTYASNLDIILSPHGTGVVQAYDNTNLSSSLNGEAVNSWLVGTQDSGTTKTGLRVSNRRTVAKTTGYGIATRLAWAYNHTAASANQGKTWFEMGNYADADLTSQKFRWGIDAQVGSDGTELMSLDDAGLLTVIDLQVGSTGDQGEMLLRSAEDGAFATVPVPRDDSNLVIDGAFDFWDEQLSLSPPSGASTYVSTMFACALAEDSGDGSACTANRQTFTLGQTSVPGEPVHFFRMRDHITGTPLGNELWAFDYKIEGVQITAGQKMTISFWTYSGPGGTVAINLLQYYGASSPDGSAWATGQEYTLAAATWTYITVTFDVPSLSGITLGDEGTDYLLIRIIKQAGATRSTNLSLPSSSYDVSGDMYFANFKAQIGAIATEFQREDLAVTRSKINRYFWRMADGGTFANIAVGFIRSTTQAHVMMPYRGLMRAAPTISNGGSFQVIYDATGVSVSSFSWGTTQADQNVLMGYATFSAISSTLVGHGAILRRNSDSTAYVQADARL